MRVLSLCSGYGGLELALGALFPDGVNTTAVCDNYGPARRTLNRRFPEAAVYSDVHDPIIELETADVVTFGFPCQDLSRVGKPRELLPTPTVVDMGWGRTESEWEAWREAQRRKHGNGNGHGQSLSQALGRLPPADTCLRMEEMMGLPRGWVTNLGLSIAAQRRLLGNGVAPPHKDRSGSTEPSPTEPTTTIRRHAAHHRFSPAKLPALPTHHEDARQARRPLRQPPSRRR